MKNYLLLLFFFLAADNDAFSDYPKNPYVDDTVWEDLKSYYLPYNTKLRGRLDTIFHHQRASASKESLLAAGFTLTETQGTRVTAVRHPALKGFVLKIYPDNQLTRVDWVSWKNRIIGSRLLKKAIKQGKYSHFFHVPKKWIYPLPAEPEPTLSVGERKNFVLVVEDVEPLPRKENWQRWRTMDNKKLLKALVNIVQKVGAGDCVRANNLPWCGKGNVALVDTEIYYRWPIRYHPLIETLSHPMRQYWKKITEGRTEKPENIITLP